VGDRGVRAVEVALIGSSGGLGEPRQAAEPEQGGVPVNQSDDAEGDRGILQREPRQPGAGEFAAGAGERAGERALGADVVVDLDGKALTGTAKGEIEGGVDVGERRNVEMLGGAEVE